jgi:hypothetical protein
LLETYKISRNEVVEKKAMFYACIPLFFYMGTNLGQMLAAAAIAAAAAASISSRRPGYGIYTNEYLVYVNAVYA